MSLRPRIRSDEDLRAELARIRKAAGLSQHELGERAGLQVGYIGKIECGTKRFGPKSLGAVLDVLGIELVVVRSTSAMHSDFAEQNRGETVLRPKKLSKQKAGRKGGRATHGRRTAAERTKRASAMAKIRWRKWRELKAVKAERERKAARRTISAPSSQPAPIG